MQQELKILLFFIEIKMSLVTCVQYNYKYVWSISDSQRPLSSNSITFGNGLFVSVSIDGVQTSPDGNTWTEILPLNNNNWTGVTFGNGLFVAVADSGTGNQVMTSGDGANWTLQYTPADLEWTSVT